MIEFLAILSISLLLLGMVTRRRVAKHGDADTSCARPEPDTAGPPEPHRGGLQVNSGWGIAVALAVFLVCTGGLVLIPQRSEPALTPGTVSAPFECEAVSDSERLRLLGEAKGVDHPIYTRNPLTQEHFNQGLLFRWGFNSLEAMKSFKIAHELDPNCAMCVWGQAYANLHHLNYLPGPSGESYPVFTAADNKATREIALRAREVAKSNIAGSPENGMMQRELQYIEALLLALPEGDTTTQIMLESSLRSAARWLSLWVEHPDDVDAGAHAAEALLLLNSWDYYDFGGRKTTHESVLHAGWSQILKDSRSAVIQDHEANVTVSESEENIIKTLFNQITLSDAMQKWRMAYPHMLLGPRAAEEIILRILDRQPFHPLATHLHIHLTEAAPLGKEHLGAAKGLFSAENLYVLGSMEGHLLHMPSHTFIRVGKFKEGVESNIRAYNKGMDQAVACISSYAPEHNLEVLVSSASLGGMFKIAEQYALLMQQATRTMPGPYMSPGHQYTSVLFVWLQFGKWSKIEDYPPPTVESRGTSSKSGYEFSYALWTFGQFLALYHSSTVEPTEGSQVLEEGDFTVLIDYLDTLENLVNAVPEVPQTKPGPSVGLYAVPYREIGRILFLMARSCLSVRRNSMVSKFRC